jgi:hypothetical protein
VTEKSLAKAREGELRVSLQSQEMDCSFARPVNISCSDLVTEKSLAEAREGELRASFRVRREMDCSFARPVNISCSDLVTEKLLAGARELDLRAILQSQDVGLFICQTC